MPVQNINEKVPKRFNISLDSTEFVLHKDAIFVNKDETVVWKSVFQNNNM